MGQIRPPPLFTTPQEQRDEGLIRIETQVRVAIRDALNRKSRKPFYWGGLKGYDQLAAIAKALGEEPCDEPETDYLKQLKIRVERVVERYRINVEDIREAHTWLRRIADCLRYPPSDAPSEPDLTSKQVQQEMDALLQSSNPTSSADERRRPSMGLGTAPGRITALTCCLATTSLVCRQTI